MVKCAAASVTITKRAFNVHQHASTCTNIITYRTTLSLNNEAVSMASYVTQSITCMTSTTKVSANTSFQQKAHFINISFIPFETFIWRDVCNILLLTKLELTSWVAFTNASLHYFSKLTNVLHYSAGDQLTPQKDFKNVVHKLHIFFFNYYSFKDNLII